MQAVIGWYMVKSGLVGRIDVSQYRLAMHLTMAFVILGITFQTLLDSNMKYIITKSFIIKQIMNFYFYYYFYLFSYKLPMVLLFLVLTQDYYLILGQCMMVIFFL